VTGSGENGPMRTAGSTHPRALQPGDGPLRLARCVLVAGPSVVLGALAHLGSEGCVSAVGLALALTVVAGASWTQLSRERSTGFLVTWIGLTQTVVHGLLTVTCAHGHASRIPARPQMLAAHLVAVLVLAILLRRGDRRIWATAALTAALRSWLRTFILWRCPAVTLESAAQGSAPAGRVAGNGRPPARGAASRRGPPAGCRA
jgi:hypothetical protein